MSPPQAGFFVLDISVSIFYGSSVILTDWENILLFFR